MASEWCVALLVSLVFLQTMAEAADQPCEVCVGFLTKVAAELSDSGIADPPKIEDYIKKKCLKSKGKDNRFCFYIGALPESASFIMNEVTKPLSWSMPPEKICDRLKSKDGQICDLKYDKQIDWKTVDLNKLRVKELKKILEDWGEKCQGCSEKSEFVREIKALMPKYVKTEL